MSNPKDIIGKPLPIQDAYMKVLGRTQFIADMSLPHMLYAKVLFSKRPHVRIVSIDTSEAEALPGVKAVLCYKNAPKIYFNSCGEDIDHMKNELLFEDRVRFVGDRVAAVAAVDEKTAAAALRLIKVEYEDLPAIFDVEEAAKPDAYPIHEGGNILTEIKQSCGDTEEAFKHCDYIFTDRYETQPIHQAAIETHGAIADYQPDGTCTVYSCTQDCYHIRQNLARLLEMSLSNVRVKALPLGGGFGGKVDMVLEGVVAVLSRMTLQPVKLVFNRQECIVSCRTRHAMVIYYKTGVMKDGRVMAQDIKLYANAGAYASGSNSIVWALVGKLFKNNKTPNISFAGYPVMTNSPIAFAMRGFGGPQVFFGQQCQFRKIADALGMDMMDMERVNLVDPDDVDLRFGAPHGNSHPKDCLEKGAELFDWYNEEKQMREQPADAKYRIGVGLAVAAHGSGMFGAHPDMTGSILKMNEDGSCTMLSPSADMGNGSVTTQCQFVSSILGISMDRIHAVAADTDASVWDFGQYGSRGTYVCGMAAIKAAEDVKKQLAVEAAKMMNVEEEDVSFHDNCVSAGEQTATLEEVMAFATEHDSLSIGSFVSHASEACPIPYGAHFVKVGVDTETGKTDVLKYVAVHDVGKVINPMALEGQIEGAMLMGMGQAISETCEVDDRGVVKNNTFRSYRIMKTTDMPKEIKIAFVEGEAPIGPYGAKSIGECCLVPANGAISNAISNALGVDVVRLPSTPERILSLLAQKNETQTQA